MKSSTEEGGRQKALVVGIRRGQMKRLEMEKSLDELCRLIDTAGGEVVGSASQEIKRVDAATFIGSGKAEELKKLAEDSLADFVVIDDELSPVQNRNLEEAIGKLVFDRTAIILDIFAMRAKTTEGKLQVELAQMEYLGPRLVGRGESFSQQTGRIGTRGPGETALEYDRRRMRDRISILKKALEGVKSHRKLQRNVREAIPVPVISMVGYTNAGKSTLMNALTDAGVFVEDKLFATLDPTVRRLKLPSGRIVLLADTVGFIRRLPHELIESFKSTFEEVERAALLLHIIDGSDEDAVVQVDVVGRVLREIGLEQKPMLEVVNKCDKGEVHYKPKGSISISAVTKDGVDKLLAAIEEELKKGFVRLSIKIPHDKGNLLSELYENAIVHKVTYGDDAIEVECEVQSKYAGKYLKI